MDATATIILRSLEAMEREIGELKKLLLENGDQASQRIEGMLKGLVVNESDFDAAKRTWRKAGDGED